MLPTKYKGVGNRQLWSYGEVDCLITFKKRCLLHRFIIIPDDYISSPILIGRDLLRKFRIQLCQTVLKYTIKQLMTLQPCCISPSSSVLSTLRLHGLTKDDRCNRPFDFKETEGHSESDEKVCTPVSCIEAFTDDTRNHLIPSEQCNPFIELCAIDVVDLNTDNELELGPLLNPEQTLMIRNLINRIYIEPSDLPTVKPSYEMRISLTHDTPVFCRPRRLSHYERTAVQKIVADLLAQKIIRPSTSPYASALVLVRKKSGEIRKCVDYRPLNKITVRDNHPLPLISDCLDHLGGKKYFTLLDLKSGFHQIHMHPDSMKYTSFVTPDGQYEYLRMPFGLKNAPPVFQRFINNTFRDLIEANKLVIYLDDILIATEDFNDHIEIISDVLTQLKRHNLELRLSKCKWAMSELDYLGYRANPSGILPSKTHLQSIENYPVPRNRKQLQSCLGLFSYFRRFVCDFSKIARPLTELLRKDVPYDFSNECSDAFATLRNKLITSPVLAIYDPAAETELHCDASSLGFGSVLMQRQPDRKLHPVAFFSKTTSSAESKLHSYELETLAIVYSLQRFHTYLEGIPFKIITDCNSLAQTLNNRSNSAKIARWSLLLENYNYTIIHRSGTAMNHADALSRCQITAAVSELDIEAQLSVAQDRDPTVSKLRTRLETEELSDFILRHGVVFHKSPSNNPQLYVPDEMIDNIIRTTHEKIGHLGVDKCCEQLRKQYWFPQMRNRVENFIRNCLKCIIYSAPARKNQRNLYNIPKGDEPFHTLHIDHLGPLPSVRSKRRYLLVVIDAFTKFVKLYPAANTSTAGVCRALGQYFDSYSRPMRIISDRGTCFTSSEFTEFLKNRSVEHIKTAVSSPQANGQVERVNRVLRPIFSKLSDPADHSDWTKYVPHVEYALNNSVHRSTGQTPSNLLFGTEQRGRVIDELTEYLSDEYTPSSPDFSEIRRKANENIEISQNYNLRHFRKTHAEPLKYNCGDYVVIRNVDTTAGTNKKFIPKYRGPYIVRKVLPHDRYIVSDLDGFQVTQMPYSGILEADKLRLWTKPGHNRGGPIVDVPNTTLVRLEIEPVY